MGAGLESNKPRLFHYSSLSISLHFFSFSRTFKTFQRLMDDWSVSESDGEGEHTLLPPPPSSLLELLHVLMKEKTLELDCCGKNEENEEGKSTKGRKRKRKRKHETQEDSNATAAPPQSTQLETRTDILSESTQSSEIRSTRTASTSECRDSRRYVVTTPTRLPDY